MPELHRQKCPQHKKKMEKEFDKQRTPFYYCPTCGYYRYYDGREGHDPSLIRGPPSGPGHYGPPGGNSKLSTGPQCPKCRRAQLVPGPGGWYCPLCGYRS